MCVDFVLGCIIAAATPSMEFIMGHGFILCVRACVCVFVFECDIDREV